MVQETVPLVESNSFIIRIINVLSISGCLIIEIFKTKGFLTRRKKKGHV